MHPTTKPQIPTRLHMHPLAHTCTAHTCTHSPTRCVRDSRPLVHTCALTHTCNHSPAHALTRPHMHLCAWQTPTRLHMHSLAHTYTHSPTHAPTHPHMHPLTHTCTCVCAQCRNTLLSGGNASSSGTWSVSDGYGLGL